MKAKLEMIILIFLSRHLQFQVVFPLTLPFSSTSFLHINSSHAQPAHVSAPDAVSDPPQLGQSRTAQASCEL